MKSSCAGVKLYVSLPENETFQLRRTMIEVINLRFEFHGGRQVLEQDQTLHQDGSPKIRIGQLQRQQFRICEEFGKEMWCFFDFCFHR